MRTVRCLRVMEALIIVAFVSVVTSLYAQTYPNKPIRFVVPYSAGGTSDIIARIIGQRLSERVGQQVVIDNRPGAGGNLGSDLVAKAMPEGYTILMGNVATHAINPSLYAKMPYDAVRDFSPVTLVADVPTVLVVPLSVPAKSVQQLITLAKKTPGALNFASAGTGTTQHLAGELFKTMAGINIVHIPYKGGGPAVTDLIGGQVSLMFPNIPLVLPYIKSGRLRALAVASSKRSSVLPDVPTVSESGLSGLEVATWFGVLGPAGVLKEVVMRLHDEIVGIVGSSETKERLTGIGADIVTSSPDEFSAYIKAEIAKWAKVIKASGARAD